MSVASPRPKPLCCAWSRWASKDEIAEERGVAERTVKGHLDHIFDKVGRRVGGRSQRAIETWVLDESLYRASLRLDRE